mmetsp:Transcript_104080/g.299592  ORF Transcript_104080/g.299592 Transcript_104080/m.299592 type:complete len:337 (-) Transcript_104080:41-1051(-)
MPMSSGGTPTEAKLSIRPKIGKPNFFATERRAIRTMAAPSETWLAFPAVVLPPARKAVFSLAKLSLVTPSRGPSSFETVTSFTVPVFLSLTFVVTGTISESNHPFFWARMAFACESAAMASWTSRVMPYFAATFSEVRPMGNKQLAASSFSKIFEDNLSKSMRSIMPNIDMDSTPPARPTSMTPVRMNWAMFATACKPLLHWRLIVVSGTSKGQPAMNWPMRELMAPAPGWEALPIWMSPTSLGSSFVRTRISLNSGTSSSSGAVSLKLPFLALPMGVRMAQQITASSSDFSLPPMQAFIGSAASCASAAPAATCWAMRATRSMAGKMRPTTVWPE